MHDAHPRRPQDLDVHGRWWPRSRDPVTELTNLAATLDARHTAVTNVMLNPAGWDSHPRRIRAIDRRIRLSWFSSLDTNLLQYSL